MTKNVMINTGTGVAVAAVDVGAATAATVTISIASPGVVTDNAHGFTLNQPLSFTTTGALPTGLTSGTLVYAIPISVNTYQVSATAGGSAINTSGTQSGVHTRTAQIFEQIVQLDANSPGVTPSGVAGTPSSAVLTVQGPATGGTPVPIQPQASAATNGETSSRVNAAATTNATNLKTSGSRLLEIDLFNVAAYSVFVKFYNKASSPTVGSDTPVWTIPIPAGSGYSKSFAFGKYFSTGLSYAITKLQADSDTTVLAAGDVTGSIDWI